MNILILDTEPRWRKHWQQQGVPTAETIVEALAALPASKIDVIVLDYLLIHHAPPLAAATGAKIAVAAGLPTTSEAIRAYRACDAVICYFVKDFNLTLCDLTRLLRQEVKT